MGVIGVKKENLHGVRASVWAALQSTDCENTTAELQSGFSFLCGLGFLKKKPDKWVRR